MKVTKFQYPLENNLIKKLDLFIKRCTQKNPKKDAVILNEGAEGEGKSTISVAEAYYIAEKTGRLFNHTRMFFDLQKMIDFLKTTKEEIAVWDEPAAQALSGDSRARIVRNLYRLLQMCRKKRHFVIINMTYFNKFSDYIVWQRPLGMIHVYSRDETQPGRFVYIRKKYLERLWMDWIRKKQRNYKKYSSRVTRGTFPDVLNPEYENNVLSDFNLEYYEKEKDKAIESVGEIKDNITLTDLKLRYNLWLYAKNNNLNIAKFSKEIGINRVTMYDWEKIPLKYPEIKYETDKKRVGVVPNRENSLEK